MDNAGTVAALWRYPVKSMMGEELNATAVVGFSLDESSAKIRTGPPKDDAEDYALPHWAGVIPLALAAGAPQADPALAPNIPLPDYLHNYRRPVRKPDA